MYFNLYCTLVKLLYRMQWKINIYYVQENKKKKGEPFTKLDENKSTN